MTLLWGIPPLVLILGVLTAALLAREVGGLCSGLRDELDRLGEIHAVVAEVRAGSAAAGRHVDHLRRH